MAVSLERLNATIADIYAAVGTPHGFQHVLGRIKVLLNGSSGMLFTPMRDAADGGFGFVDHLNTDLFAEYRSYYWDKDPWGTEAKRKGLWYHGSTGTDEALIAQREFRRHEIYADYLTRLDTVRLCFTVVAGDSASDLPGTHLSIYRGVGSRPFDDEDCKVLALLRPHVAQALRLAHQLQFAEARTSSAWGVLNLLRCGVVLVDGKGIIVFMNEAAERLLEGEHGIFAVRHGAGVCKLRGRAAHDDHRLQASIAAAVARADATATGAREPVALGRNSPGGCVLVTAVSLPAHLQGNSSATAKAAILLDTRHSSDPPDLRALTALCGATDAECRVAAALVAGRRVKAIAAQLGIAESTVRTHLRALYGKTGTRGMPELVSVLAKTLATPLRR